MVRKTIKSKLMKANIFGLFFVANILFSTIARSAPLDFETTLVSKDNSSTARMFHVVNARQNEELHENLDIIFFEKANTKPLIVYASMLGTSANLASWTGSSKFCALVTGSSKDSEMGIVYNSHGKLKFKPLDLKALYKFGLETMKNDRDDMHDGVIEVVSGEGDSVTFLYYRTAYPRRFVLPVKVNIEEGDSEPAIKIQYDPKDVTYLETWDKPIPTAEELGVKLMK
jgi:hypothetical protein